MGNKQIFSGLMLALTALIWGAAFVAQSVGMDYVGPITFNGMRNVLAALFLVPVIWIMDRRAVKKQQPTGRPQTKQQRAVLLRGGVSCGILLTLATTAQQMGMQYASVGKAGFITALYIVIVPVLGVLFLHKRSGLQVWAGVVIALGGLYLLCMTDDGLALGKGEWLVLLSSVLFSLHILVIDHYSPMVDGTRLSCIQFVVVAVICVPLSIAAEQPSLSAVLSAWAPLLYAGILSSGVGYTLQIVAQKNVQPTVASLILSLESVFSVLAGWVLLHQNLSARELTGCVLMFGAIILAQLPSKNKTTAVQGETV